MVEPIDVVKQVHKHVSGTGGAALRGLGAVSSVNRITVPGISQDNIIFAALLFAFIVWITSKGELPTYIAFFKPGASQGPTPVPVTATPSTGATATTTQSPYFGGTLTPSGIPGVPGLSKNPFAGIPGLGSLGQIFTGTNTTSSGANTTSAGSQLGSLFTSLKNLF